MESFPIQQIFDRIRFENPWWNSGETEAFYREKPRREYFPHFAELAGQTAVRRAAVLMGPRRVGKTVMLHHYIQHLLDGGISPRRIIFLSVDHPVYHSVGLEQLFKLARQTLGAEEELGGWHLIFDEVQYLKDWEVHLKSLVDTYHRSKFVVSGSAAAALRYKSQESGAGRFSDFVLPPLTFFEFIKMQRLDYFLQPAPSTLDAGNFPFQRALDIQKFNQHFLDYINFGGYPEAIFSEALRQNPVRFLRSDVIEKVILRDLPGLYGIQDTQELNSFFTKVAFQTAQEFSLDGLSKQSRTPKHTLKKYLEYLESAFLIQIVRRVDQAGRRFQRENFFKIYLTNPSLRSALFAPLQAVDKAMGAMAETAVFAQWMHRQDFQPYYARWQNGEVDMVGIHQGTLKPEWALEIKWSDAYPDKPQKLKSLLKFCNENKLKEALVTTINIEKTVEHQGVKLHFVPASTYAFSVGLHTLSNPFS